MNITPKFVCTVKRGAKRVGVAVTSCDAATCISAAETVFRLHGIRGDVSWADVMRQKNYVGGGEREVSATADATSLFWYSETLAGGPYFSLARFYDTFPEAERFHAELSKVTLRQDPFALSNAPEASLDSLLADLV